MAKDFCCNLGSLNLAEFIINPYTDKAEVNYELLKKAIEIAIEGLDVLVDENANHHPLEVQKINSLNYRNIGLGIMGFGTALFKLGITYGSEESKKFTDDIFSFLFKIAVVASSELAKEKGIFPKYKECVWDSEIIKKHFNATEIKKLKKNGIRNCSLISIAPNGSIGTMLGITGGCEPEFALKFTRKTESLNDGEEKHYDIYCNAIQEYQQITGNKNIPNYFVSSSDIKWQDRVEIQGIMQDHVDTAISSTVNLPKETTLDEIELLYLTAWKRGLKGITIFKSGGKRQGILTTESKEKTKEEFINKELPWGTTIIVNDDVIGKKRKLTSGCGSLHCTAFFDPIDGRLMELYLSKGSTGGCNNFMTGLSRMISHSARTGATIESIVDQLMSSGTCPSYSVRNATKHDTSKGSSCPVAIGYALMDMYKEIKDELGLDDDDLETPIIKEIKPTKVNLLSSKSINKLETCPECGEESLVHEIGCNTCKSCGFSKCD